MLIHQAINSRDGYRYNGYVYRSAVFAPHFHKNLELVYVLQGRLEYTVGGNTQLLEAGDFALVLPNQVHSCAGGEDSLCWIGVFSADFVRAFQQQVRGKRAESSRFRCSRPVTEFFCATMISSADPEALAQPPRRGISQRRPQLLLAKAALYGVCAEFADQAKWQDSPREQGAMLARITDYIGRKHTQQISLHTMARELGYNYHYLSKCFQRELGMSFTRYLTTCRLETAQELLLQTELDIGRVALDSGFQSVRSFNDHFKEAFAMTPSQYRRGGIKNT